MDAPVMLSNVITSEGTESRKAIAGKKYEEGLVKGFDKMAFAATSAGTISGGTCPIKNIPAEIRNSIYELAFKFEDHQNNLFPQDLENAEPPGKAILLTCRQFFEEAKHMYTTTARDFWSTGKFAIRTGKMVQHTSNHGERTVSWDKSYATDIDDVSEWAISHIKRLELHYEHRYVAFKNGVWYRPARWIVPSRCFAIVPEVTCKPYRLEPDRSVERHLSAKKIRVGKKRFMKLECDGYYRREFERFVVSIDEASLTRAKIRGMMRGA